MHIHPGAGCVISIRTWYGFGWDQCGFASIHKHISYTAASCSLGLNVLCRKSKSDVEANSGHVCLGVNDDELQSGVGLVFSVFVFGAIVYSRYA